jgi:predicted nuclease with RNAse H fold
MSKKRTGDEVGYGKPPKDTQFQKGVSGNPNGRPKKCRNFDEELIRESESLMPITENGQRKRLSKHEVAIKQLINQVISGSPSAQRMYFRLRQQAHERAALVRGL